MMIEGILSDEKIILFNKFSRVGTSWHFTGDVFDSDRNQLFDYCIN